VNSIQVIPSVLDEERAKEESHPARKASPVSVSIYETTTRMQTMARNGVPVNEILEFAQSRPHIASAISESGNAIKLTLEGGQPLLVVLPQEGTEKVSKEDLAQRSKATLQNRVRQIEGRLKAGRCVIFVNGGLSGKNISKKFPGLIPKIMEDSSLSEDEKFAGLRKILATPIAADIMANYSAEQWEFARE
jgi:hypothetical protein